MNEIRELTVASVNGRLKADVAAKFVDGFSFETLEEVRTWRELQSLIEPFTFFLVSVFNVLEWANYIVLDSRWTVLN